MLEYTPAESEAASLASSKALANLYANTAATPRMATMYVRGLDSSDTANAFAEAAAPFNAAPKAVVPAAAPPAAVPAAVSAAVRPITDAAAVFCSASNAALEITASFCHLDNRCNRSESPSNAPEV